MTEEHRLRLFDRILRIFVPKKDKVKGQWRRLHNKGLYDLYFSLNSIRVIKSSRMGWAGHVARMGLGQVHTGLFFVGIPEVRRPLVRLTRRWEGNIEMDFQEVGLGYGRD
jgi:hypothetical protein